MVHWLTNVLSVRLSDRLSDLFQRVHPLMNSVYPYMHPLFIHPSIPPSNLADLSVCLSVCSSICPSIHSSFCLSVRTPNLPYICQLTHCFIGLSNQSSIHLCMHAPIQPHIYPFLNRSVCLPTHPPITLVPHWFQDKYYKPVC